MTLPKKTNNFAWTDFGAAPSCSVCSATVEAAATDAIGELCSGVVSEGNSPGG